MGKAAEIMGSILTLIGLIIFGVSIGTVGWYTYETPAVFYEEGLFETCYTPTGESEVCRSLGELFDVVQKQVFYVFGNHCSMKSSSLIRNIQQIKWRLKEPGMPRGQRRHSPWAACCRGQQIGVNL